MFLKSKRMKERSVTKLHGKQDSIDPEGAEGSQKGRGSCPQCPLRALSLQGAAAASAQDKGDDVLDAAAGAGRAGPHEQQGREGCTAGGSEPPPPPSPDCLRALLKPRLHPDAHALDQSGGGNDNCVEGVIAGSTTEVLPSGDVCNCEATGFISEDAAGLDQPWFTASTISADPETIRRRTLFEIERLMLEARPYDSIDFLHVQRELTRFLGLEPHRGASLTFVPAPKATKEERNSGGGSGFWKRLRSRLWRDGAGCSQQNLKGDGDIDMAETALQKP